MGVINRIKIQTKLLVVLILTGGSLAMAIGIATSILHERMIQDRIVSCGGI